jgi:hypothetical protein
MTMLFAAFPVLDFLLAAAFLFLRFHLTRRDALLVSTTVTAAWLVLGTELLSLFHALTFGPVLAWWLLPMPVLAWRVFRDRGRRRWMPPTPMPGFGVINYLLITLVVVTLGWAWCQAVFSPPNNADSQEYHLQRQLFWMQQQSVEHFPTSNLRQVAMPPLTEFAGLHLMILTGNDRLHNLVQWTALLLTLAAVTLITRRFNCSPTAQWLAALWTVTIPTAFLQASNTKNDVVVMLFLAIAAHWVLLLDTRSRVRFAHVVLIGIAFGALALTKGTGVIFGLPVGVLAAWYLIRRRPRLALPSLALIGGAALLMNAGHFVRNYRTFKSVAPDQPGIHAAASLGNEDHSIGALISILARNLGSQCVTPSQAWDDKLTDAIRALHVKLGRELDDPRTTWVPFGRFRPYQFWQNDEDKAAAPAHLLLILLLPIALLVNRRRIPWRVVWPLLGCALVGFVLFSFLLKWQNWHVRLIFPPLALIAPVFAWAWAAPRSLTLARPPIVDRQTLTRPSGTLSHPMGEGRGEGFFEQNWSHRDVASSHAMRWVILLPAALLFITVTASFNSIQRPLIGSNSVFHADPLVLRCCYHGEERAPELRALADRLAETHVKTVGFLTEKLAAMAPDYVIQRLLLDQLPTKPLFTSFNATLQIPGKPEPDPDVVLVARSNAKRLQHESTGTWYAAGKKFERYTLFWRESENSRNDAKF